MKGARGLLVSNTRVARPHMVRLLALTDTGVPIEGVGDSITSYRRWTSRSERVARRSSGSPSIRPARAAAPGRMYARNVCALPKGASLSLPTSCGHRCSCPASPVDDDGRGGVGAFAAHELLPVLESAMVASYQPRAIH